MIDPPNPARPEVLVLPPNWFAAVMGTGIIAVAGAVLRNDVGLSGPTRAAVDLLLGGVWLCAAAMLALAGALAARAWRHAPAHARAHLEDPAVAPFHGAIPMAMLTVGSGALLLGSEAGLSAAVWLDVALWAPATVLGAAGALAFAIRGRRAGWLVADAAWGGWLMPVVPPMVSASAGALLLPHVPDGPARSALLVGCAALALISAALAAPVIAAVAARAARHGLTERGIGSPRVAPTLWIALGPLGQGATAAAGLGAPLAVVVGALAAAGAWSLLAVAATRRALRADGGLPFSLAWWAFVFPLGTCVTGAAGLGHRLGSGALLHGAAMLYLAVVGAWLVVVARTVRGIADGSLIPLAAQPEAAGTSRRLAW